MKIAHIADIHIRGLTRHDEYKELFNDFIQKCIETNIEHIFIGGDIFHTKTSGLTPEYIDLITNFLNTLANAFNVHIILGNHDGNLANLSRQDSITPIVNAINNKNIFLYKNSGVYEFSPGFNWCVFSLFDKENWDKVKPINNKINIACYHGPIVGAITESGWKIDDGLSIEQFNAFDFTFLGDIHQFQTLKTKNNRPVVYCGSAIQQNYSEDLEHGYVEWDIKSIHDYVFKFN